jgi:hypothetical protein
LQPQLSSPKIPSIERERSLSNRNSSQFSHSQLVSKKCSFA